MNPANPRPLTRSRRMWKWIAALVLVVLPAVFATGCLRVSNGVWHVRDAPRPDGWPSLTPIGQVEVKDYPDTRAAVVTDETPDDPDTNMNPAFMTLFNHIKSRDIAMTAPVDMTFAEGTDGPNAMKSMAFLYRRPDQGVTEANGRVTVEDQPAQAYASLGVRGNYTGQHITDAITELDVWLDEHADTWQPVGPPRYLGYNGPFVPWFFRYGEVQRPVEPVNPQ